MANIKNFIKKIIFVKPLLNIIRSRRSNTYKHKIYGKVYYPYYNKNVKLNNNYPDLFNHEGKKIELFFLRDIHNAHSVYSDSKYFQFDRYNFALNTHFYTHNCMLETMGSPLKKYGMLVESEIIVPYDYLIFKRHKNLAKEFDLIFTSSEKILDELPNSRYIPYYIKRRYKDFCPDQYKNKTKNISIIASNKQSVPLHKKRHSIAIECKNNKFADTYGAFDGGSYCSIEEPFQYYRFSIVIENEITSYCFTEKITNCFAAMAIPVYLGAQKIDKLFNPDGIIQFNQNDDIEQVLKQCTKEYYEERIPAIIENYNKVTTGKSTEDIMYEKYIRNDSGKITPEELFKSI